MKIYKILYLLYKLEVGGAERVVCTLAKGLDRSRFNPVVASFKGGPLADELRKEGIPVHIIGKKGRFDVYFPLKLYRLLKRERVDILHTHTFSPNFWGRIVGKLAGIPAIITTEHTLASHKSFWQRKTDKFLERYADKIIAVCNAVKQSIVSLSHIDESKIIIIYNGVEDKPIKSIDPVKLQQLRKDFNLDSKQPVLLTIGRLIPDKGHTYLLDAIKLVGNKHLQVKLLIVGDGPLKEALKHKAEDIGIEENIIFTGYRNDTNNLFQIADIVVFPSLREGFSVALVEAMSVGKPIIATDVGGNKEAIESQSSGILIPSRNSVTLAESIVRLINNKKLADALGKRAQQTFNKDFTQLKMINRTQNLYSDLMKQIA